MKNTIKIIFSIMLCITMLVLTACSNNNTKDDANNSKEEQNNSTPTEEAVVDDGLTIEERVIFDKRGIKVTATEYKGNSKISNFYFTIENNSDRKTDVYSYFTEFNGLMANTFSVSSNSIITFNETLEPGEKKDVRTYITAKDKKMMGIETITDIEFEIVALIYDDAGKYKTDSEHSERITLKTSATDYVQKSDNSGEVVYDKNGIKIINKGLVDNHLVFFCENTSDKKINVYSIEGKIDGEIVSVNMDNNYLPGTKGYMPLLSNRSYYTIPKDAKYIELKFEIKEYTSDTIDTPTIRVTF